MTMFEIGDGMFDFHEMQRLMSRIAPTSPADVTRFRGMDPVRTAATFGALLTVPELQGNCPRLEILAHHALALGDGARKPSAGWVIEQFLDAGAGMSGRLEDPAEDVFVTYCTSSRGGFRVFEGIWESNGFFLQRFIDVIEQMPDAGPFAPLKRSIFALLTLSEAICERSGLKRYQRGAAYPCRHFPPGIGDRLSSIRRRTRFTIEDLDRAGVSLNDLLPFICGPSGANDLDAELGHTWLERRPLVLEGGDLFVILPTAISAAIRRYVLETVDHLDARELFLASLGRNYLDLIQETPLLGGPIGEGFHFHRTEHSAFAGGTMAIDRGRYLNLVFMMDTLEGVEHSGLIGRNPNPALAAPELARWLEQARTDARTDPHYVGGVTLLVSCGVGRAGTVILPEVRHDDWRIESLPAADLVTLSHAKDFNPQTVWRMLDAQEALEAQGYPLHNVNGLLNLAAWNRSLDGHMVPHDQMPDDRATARLVVPQNALIDLRHEVASGQDVHIVMDPEGVQRTVRHHSDNIFEEDNRVPIYVQDGHRERRGVRAVFRRPSADWWFDITVPDGLDASAAQDYWTTVSVWLTRTVPIAEAAFPDLPTGAIRVECDFTAAALASADEDGPSPGGVADIRRDIAVAVDAAQRTVDLVVGPAFEHGGLHADNIAEQALAGALLTAMAELARAPLDPDREVALMRQAAPDLKARQRHRFAISRFLDTVRGDLAGRNQAIDPIDEAVARLGLGWRVRDRSTGAWVRGKAECTAFLNAVVRALEDEIANELRGFNRKALLERLLYAHEACANDGARWERTAGAVIALRKDQDAVRQIMTERASKRAELSQTARVLMEIGLCEASPAGGRLPGTIDVSRLLAKLTLLMTYSGWSGAIRWDAMEPTLKVSALGDILAHVDLIDDIAAPFARTFNDLTVDAAISRYAKNLEQVDGVPTVEKAEDAGFYAALADTTGVSFDELRTFIDCVENLGVHAGKAVMAVKRSDLIGLGNEHRTLSVAASQALFDFLTLAPRSGWRGDSAAVDPRDLDLWRPRRTIAVLRRPLMQIDDNDDPTLLFAPGLVRSAVLFMIGNYLDGSFPDWQLRPAMVKWRAREADRRGRALSESVASRLKATGWSVAETDLKVTKALDQGFDVNPGDIDVLAWRRDPDRVLVIECKDVQFKRTLGEIAEQLADFRGETVGGKRDYLRKHLDRMDLLRRHQPALARFIGWDHIASVESHLVFKNPVPVQYALKRMASDVMVSTEATLLSILEAYEREG